MLSVFFAPAASAQVGWTIGGSGVVFKSYDWGWQWEQQYPPGNQPLRGLYVQNADRAWIAGGSVIFRTMNGGDDWTPNYDVPAAWNAITFVDPQRGWAVGATGKIARTTDAGGHWVAQTSNTSLDLFSTDFVSGTRGWAVGSGVRLKTTDGGGTWSAEFSAGFLRSVDFVDASHGWAAGNGGRVAWTDDGGASWHDYFLSGTSAALNSVVFLDPLVGFLAGGSTIYKTTNGGQGPGDWLPKHDAGGSILESLYFVNPQTGWAVGTLGTVLYTTDGGETWAPTPSQPGTSATLRSVGFKGGAPTIQVQIGTSPSGRSFEVDGTTYTVTQLFTWTEGSPHVLSTPSPQLAGLETRYVWTQWSNGGPQTQQVSPVVPTTYTASFAEEHYLTMASTGTGSTSPSSGWKAAGSNVTITANALCGAEFLGWTGTGPGSYSGLDNPAVISMDAPVHQTAMFTAVPGPPAVVYVDQSNGSGVEDGSCLHPFTTVTEGVNAVQSGGTIYVVAGMYEETLVLPPASAPMKAMTVRSIDGSAVIGPTAN